VTQVASIAGDTSADNEAGGHGETLAPNPYVLSNAEGPLDRDELVAIDAWWRATNFLAVGQIYLLANPLLREPLRPKPIKPRPLGHFGSVPGLNFVCLDDAVAVGDDATGVASRRSSWKRAVWDEEVAL
jgi:xylulose-5-phosphate/fructose-6-phosphate phosphoketolase